MNKFIISSDIDAVEGIEYLHLYLDPKFSFKIKLNGEEVEENQIYIKAPTLSSTDVYDIRKCSSVIAKFEEDKNNKMTRELKSLKEDELQKLMKLYEDVNKDKKELSEEDFKNSCREHIQDILRSSKVYQLDKDDFYSEFDKLIHFLQKRAFRMFEGAMLPLPFEAFNHLFAQKQFLFEAVFAEYVSFFSKHFPLESLSLQNN